MPQFSVDSRTIDNVIGYINNGQISIPEIQRPFVWDGSKIRDLIDSLYNGFPVGYLIVWQNPNMKDKEGNLTSGKMIMIDGQQRVTAIMTALVGMKVLDKDFNERVYKIAFNPFAQNDEQRFEVQSAAILKDKRWISDIAELFKPEFNSWEFVESFCQANPDMERPKLSSLIQNVINIKNCPIGIIHLNDGLSIDDVTEIFIRINSQGKALTQADFVMSTIASDEKYGGSGRCNTGPLIAEEEAVRIAICAANTLDYVHNANPGFIFRDVKPVAFSSSSFCMIFFESMTKSAHLTH